MAQRKLKDYMERCMAMLDELNIPYSKDIKELSVSHAEHRWGRTVWRNVNVNGVRERQDYKIEISYKLINEKYTPTDDGLINTMIHELLHTTPDGSGHTGMWKVYAEKVYSRYGIDIKRCGSDDDKGCNSMSTYKYIVQCPKCQKPTGRYRTSKLILHPENFRCRVCGSPIVRIK